MLFCLVVRSWMQALYNLVNHFTERISKLKIFHCFPLAMSDFLFVLVSLCWCTWILMDIGQWCMVNNSTSWISGSSEKCAANIKINAHLAKSTEKKIQRHYFTDAYFSKHIQDDIKTTRKRASKKCWMVFLRRFFPPTGSKSISTHLRHSSPLRWDCLLYAVHFHRS